VTIPPAQNAVAKYPIAVIKATKSEALAQAFISYVLGPGAQSVLEDAGFQAP
jgi:molybdate transport system substrate-binding protein